MLAFIIFLIGFIEFFVSLLLFDIFLKVEDSCLIRKLLLSMSYSCLVSYLDTFQSGMMCSLLFITMLVFYGFTLYNKYVEIVVVSLVVTINVIIVNGVFLLLGSFTLGSIEVFLTDYYDFFVLLTSVASKFFLFLEYLYLYASKMNGELFDKVALKWVICITAISLISLHTCLYEHIDDSISLGSCSIIFCCVVVTNLLVYTLCLELSEKARNNIRHQILLEAVRYEDRTKCELEDMMEQMMRISHDFDKHILAIKGLMEDSETELAKEYVDKISLESRSLVFSTDSSVLNYLLGKKLTDASKQGIDIHYMVLGKTTNYIDDVDMTALIGNLLDNAIEAALRSIEKRIEIRIELQDPSLSTFVVKNSYNHVIKESSGKLMTTKLDTKHHGVGMKVISEIVDKYNGQDYYKYEDGIFSHMCVLLNGEKT